MRSKLFIIASVILLFAGTAVVAQDRDKTTGSIKGKVRVEKGTPEGVIVVLRQGEKEISRTPAGRKGDFVIPRITPGIYGVSFRKPGLTVGSIDNIEVRAGKTRSLGDGLILSVDDGSIAFIRGSVFTEEGRSVAGVRIELGRVYGDGSVKKLDARITNETGQFVFRLPPDLATYRLSLKADRAQPASQDIEVDGAAVYRRALTLKPVTN
ncbi:MAG: carboxypeptidase regulatory-like domain-containing protein [Pyrinomonadaceae bacterium]